MKAVKDAISRLWVGPTTSSSRVEAMIVTDGTNSLVVGTRAYGKGVDPATISEADKIAHAEQALLVAHWLAGSQKPGR